MARRTIRTPGNEEIMRVRYPREGPESLAKEWGVKPNSVAWYAKDLGLKSEDRYRNRAKRNRINYSFFDQWSDEMAYFLGYIFADGYIGEGVGNKKLMLVAVTRDEEILLRIRERLGSLHHVHRKEGYWGKDGYYHKPTTRVVIPSALLVEGLMRHGVRQGKSKLDLSAPSIPNEFLGSFTRGFLDGDGSISVNKRGFCRISLFGTPGFLESLRDSLVKVLGVTKSPLHEHYARRSVSKLLRSVHWGKGEDLLRFSTFWYSDSSLFCLERKKKKLLNWLRGENLRDGIKDQELL